MHCLHRILVKIEIKNKDNFTRNYLISQARLQAEEMTNSFQDNIYDWREIDSAGGWCEDYPENVLLEKENKNKIMQELKTCMELQKNELNLCMQYIKQISNDLTLLKEKFLEYNNQGEFSPDLEECSLYLVKLSKILRGEYTIDSFFYNTYDSTSKINKNTFENFEEKPEDWALVLFDCHY